MMRFWRKLRDRGLDDFADAIRPELREMPAPKPHDELLARIIASRNAGARVILPHDTLRETTRPFRYLGTIAAAVVAFLLASTLLDRRPADDDVSSAPSWFTHVAFAQTPPPGVLPVQIKMPERLRPIVLKYQRTVDGKLTTHTDLTLQRDSVGTIPAWRLVVSRRAIEGPTRSIDTVVVARNDLRPLRVVARVSPYSSFARIRISQTFEGLHVVGDMNAERLKGEGAHRTFDRQLPSALGPYVPDAIAPIYLMGVEFAPGWKGRLAVLGWLVRNDDVSTTLEMRVDGEEVVRVPAGEFDCWRITVNVGGERQLYWARKSDGLGIKSRSGASGKPVRENLLTSEQR
jgi:hypothetical protein